MNFTRVSWGFTELACLANLSQVGQCVSSAFLAHTMSLSDVCDSFSLYMWLYVCPKVDLLADQMLYMYGSTHSPVTLSPSRLLTTKRSTCAETRTQGGVWVREFLGSLSLAYFVRRLIIIQPPWLLTVARTKERKKMQHSHLYLISWKYHPYPHDTRVCWFCCADAWRWDFRRFFILPPKLVSCCL